MKDRVFLDTKEAPIKSRCRDLVGATYPFLRNEVKQKLQVCDLREALNFLLYSFKLVYCTWNCIIPCTINYYNRK